MHFLVTGATGFIGSQLLFRLLEEGAAVTALVRPASSGSGIDRLEPLREHFSFAEAWPPPGLEVVEGDIRRPHLGLGETTATRLFARIDQVLHCAAMVDFAADQREAVMETNLGSLDNLLPLVRAGRTVLNFVSTAYVCGETKSIVQEAAAASRPTFRNPYEESKYEAERRLIQELGADGIGYRVLRPSIVIGEHATGRTSSFNTLYVFLEMVEKLHERAVREESDLSIRIRCQEQTRLNLVPVDWLAETILGIVRSPQTEGRFFHLTNPAPVRLRELADLLSEIYPLLLATGVDDREFENRVPDSRERTVDRGLALYRGYLENHPRFDNTNTHRTVADGGCPPLDGAWLSRLIAYARGADWGRGRRQPVTEDADGSFAYCRDFFDSHLVGRTGDALLPTAPKIDALFEVRLTDRPDFRRHIELEAGRVKRVGRAESAPQWSYELPSGVLRRIASSRLDPREAFFSRQAEIRGDLEAGLRFANMIVEFFRDSPFEMAADAD